MVYAGTVPVNVLLLLQIDNFIIFAVAMSYVEMMPLVGSDLHYHYALEKLHVNYSSISSY